MNEIIILFLIFGTLFIMEKKSINILAYYIGMVIIIAIVISNTPNVSEINKNILNTIATFNTSNIITDAQIAQEVNIGYISYILVLVQISALTILFGFIIMLFPKNNTDILINKKNIITTIKTSPSGGKLKTNKKIIISIISIIILLLSYKIIISTKQYNQWENILYNIIYELSSGYTNYEINKTPEMENTTSIFIKKISELIYSDISNIIKFMVITIILLFAIIGLFYILLPTYL